MVNAKREKVVVIPVTFVDKEPKLLIVLDKKFNEWTFITGGCKLRESHDPLRAGLRELEEETRGVINIKNCTYSYFNFRHVSRDFENSMWHVYIVDVPLNREQQLNTIGRFNYLMKTTEVSRAYDENIAMDWVTIGDLYKRNLWTFIRYNILQPGSTFYSLWKNTSARSKYSVDFK